MTVVGAATEAVSWDRLDGWSTAAADAAFAAFRRSAAAILADTVPLRPALPTTPALVAAGREAVAMAEGVTADAARHFFESRFEPCRIRGAGLLTGYYEPVVDGALVRTDAFTAPVLDRPAGWPQPMPDRAAWEAFALTDAARPVVWLRDWTEVFLIHVQGSARVRLTDGSRCRLVYAGRNGLPYTSIGRRLIESGRIREADMSLAVLKAWLRANGQDPGDAARTLMQENRSYIFFRREADDGAGPTGGQGLPLEAGVSIAVDRSLWCYGLPFWIGTAAPVPGFGPAPLRRLFIAQDTGSAILGAARADLFCGSGETAGEAAGAIRHPADVTVLLPRAAA